MMITPTSIGGVYEVQPEMMYDERGAFARVSCVDEFSKYGLPADWSQSSISWNPKQYTLRGMHYQEAPHGEHKLVRCTRGRIYDVAIDLRVDSPTRLQWHAVELTMDNRLAIYIPPGVAHGFQTLEVNSEVLYHIKEPYCREAARGVRWDDPAFSIDWPTQPHCIAEKDTQFPLFQED